MLSTARRISARHRHSCRLRAHTTEANTLQDWTRNEERAKIPRVSMARESIHVRTWDFPASIAEAYAIVRGVERKYGRIRDYKWMRDADMSQAYQGVLWATFYSPNSLDHIPRIGEILHIPLPPIDPAKEGGVGFHDIIELLKPSDKVEDESQLPEYSIMKRVIDSGQPAKEGETEPKMLDIRVERAIHDTVFYPDILIPHWTVPKRAALCHALLDWGGFAPMQPMFGSKSPYNSDQEDIPVDGDRMRQLLNYASQLTGRPDPSFEPPTSGQVTDDLTPEIDIQVQVEDLPPAPSQSRSWSLPPPPPDDPLVPQTESQSKRPRHAPFMDAKPSTSPVGARRQQMLAKAKSTAHQKSQNKGGKKADGVGLKKGEVEKPKKLTVEKKESKSIPRENENAPAGIKKRVWDIVGKWF